MMIGIQGIQGAIFGTVFIAMLAADAAAATRTTTLTCKGGKFTATAPVDPKTGEALWNDEVTVKLAGEAAQRLLLDPSDSDRSTWKNEHYRLYSFKQFTSLEKLQGGRIVKVYDACR